MSVRIARSFLPCVIVALSIGQESWGFDSPAVSPAPADTESLIPAIQVSAEEFAHGCQLGNDAGPGVRTVYIRHEFNIGSTASRFRLSLGSGVSMTYLSETHPFPMTAGNTQTGISVCYGTCIQGPLVLATVSYMYNGSDVSCGRLDVVPHPDAQTVEVINCFGTPEVAFASDMYILKPGGICGCPDPHTFTGSPQSFDCAPLRTENVTWGAIKALYRN